MLIGCVCLWVFAIILCMYGVFRDPVTRNTGLNLAISAVWTYDGLAATLLVELALVLNPRMTASLGISNMSGNGSSSGPTSNSLTTTDGRNVTSMDTTNSKWEKYGTASHGSVGNGNHTMSNGGFSTGGFGSTGGGGDGLPRYSLNDMSMDILKGQQQAPNSNAGFYTTTTVGGDLSQPSSPLSTYAQQHSTLGGDGLRGIEQDQMNYNATTGQVRTPPRYVIPPIDERQLDMMDSYSTLGGNQSVMSSSHLMGSYTPSHHH